MQRNQHSRSSSTNKIAILAQSVDGDTEATSQEQEKNTQKAQKYAVQVPEQLSEVFFFSNKQ